MAVKAGPHEHDPVGSKYDMFKASAVPETFFRNVGGSLLHEGIDYLDVIVCCLIDR